VIRPGYLFSFPRDYTRVDKELLCIARQRLPVSLAQLSLIDICGGAGRTSGSQVRSCLQPALPDRCQARLAPNRSPKRFLDCIAKMLWTIEIFLLVLPGITRVDP